MLTKLSIPQGMTNKAIGLYIVLLVVISVAFTGHALPILWIIFGLVEVLTFFLPVPYLSKKWMTFSSKEYIKRLFILGFTLRVAYVTFMYFFYIKYTGQPFAIHAADEMFYHGSAVWGAQYLRNNFSFQFFSVFFIHLGTGISDAGYATYLSILYYLTGDSVWFARVVKSVLSAFTAVLIYKLAKRQFDEPTARVAGILCMLMPNFFYYCGIQLKETEMVFLIVLFAERADNLLRQSKFVLWPTIFVVLIGASLFTFRTVLGAVAFIAFIMTLVLSSSRIVNWGRRILVIILALSMIGLVFQDTFESEIREYTSVDVQAYQQGNMQWRSQRSGDLSQRFASKASAAVFAPIIFTIPFPTLVNIDGQEIQMLMNGGNFVKNITSGFTLIALVLIFFLDDKLTWTLFKGRWREHLLPIAILGGYLLVLVFSAFAHSERFHLPSIPFALMFTAYGMMHLPKKWEKLFMVWIVIIFIANIGWAWFKLAGRGMI